MESGFCCSVDLIGVLAAWCCRVWTCGVSRSAIGVLGGLARGLLRVEGCSLRVFTGLFGPNVVLLEGSKVVGSNLGLVSRGPGFSTGSIALWLASGLGFSGDL